MRIGISAVALVLALATTALGQEKKAELFQDLTWDAAAAKAKAENKVVFIDFYTSWCMPCKKLDKVTWQDAKVIAYLNEQAVPLKLDAEKGGKELAQKYKINLYPTMVFINPDGTEVGRLMGYMEPAEFLKAAAAKLGAKKSGAPAGGVANAAGNPLIRERKYKEFLAATGDAPGVTAKAVETLRGAAKSDSAGEQAEAARQARTRLGDFYEARLGAQQADGAGQIAEQWLEVEPRGATYVLLIERAVRAGNNEVARALSNRGLKAVKPEEQAAIKSAAATIPAK